MSPVLEVVQDEGVIRAVLSAQTAAAKLLGFVPAASFPQADPEVDMPVLREIAGELVDALRFVLGRMPRDPAYFGSDMASQLERALKGWGS